MGMGSAYAGGAGMVRKLDSYVPLINTSIARSKLASETDIADREMDLKELMYAERDKGLTDRSGGRGGGRGLADRENERRKLKLLEEEAEQRRQDDWSRKNQYMAGHHGMEPTPEELAETQYGRESEEKALDREESARQFDENLAAQEREKGLMREELSRKDGSGLKGREDARRSEKHRKEMTAADMEIDKEKRTEDYDTMMKSFLTGDYQEVSAWFIRNGSPGTDESLNYPIIEPTDDPEMVSVTWPGQEEPQTMPKDTLGELFARMNPKFEERPKKSKKSKGKMSQKDAAKAADSYAKGVSKDDPDYYEEAYRKKYAELMGGQSEKTVVRRQRNRKTGQTRITYSDGTTEIQ